MADIRVVCCACARVIRDGALDAEGRVSHGMCDACGRRFYPDLWAQANAESEARA